MVELSDIECPVDARSGRPDLSGKHILIVEDEPAGRLFIEEMLLPTGADISASECGEDALSRVEDSDYDLIIIDVHLPGIDGMETARRLRRAGNITPIVSVSGMLSRLKPEWADSVGIDAHIGKPIDVARLDAVLRTFL